MIGESCLTTRSRGLFCMSHIYLKVPALITASNLPSITRCIPPAFEALLVSGLPDAPSDADSRKNNRQYFYYVCLNAQRMGWAACPGKSLSARAIEESVLKRLREAQPALFGAAEWEHMDRTRQVVVMRGLVERVGYDGADRQISIRFRAGGEQESA